MAIADKITKANNGVWASPATITGSKNIADTTVGISVATGWPVDATDGPVHIKLFKVDTDNKLIEGTASDHKATLAGTTLSNIIKTGGPDVDYETGDPCIIYPTAGFWNDIYDALVQSLNKDGTLKTAAVQQALGITSLPPPDWTVLPVTPSSVVNEGQRSYTLTYPGVDYTDRLQPGTRLRTTRTVAAPTKSTLLNGTSQYWSKTSPTKLTFTDDFAISAYVKISANQNETIISRFDGNNGWQLSITNVGQIILAGYAGSGGANYSQVISRQSVPLNKWVHISAQLDMSAYSASPTTSYIMIDSVDVPVEVQRGGTNPTALVQAGDLNVGRLAGLGTQYFAGCISQVAIFNNKVTQTTMRGYCSQGLLGNEANLASGFSFNIVSTDLNTATPNDLVPSGGANATNADSPFGNQASGLVSATTDYGIVMKAVFASDTTVVVQVPSGCTIPTSGGLSSTSYSSAKTPYGFNSNAEIWTIHWIDKIPMTTSSSAAGTYNPNGMFITTPVGAWNISEAIMLYVNRTSSGSVSVFFNLGTSSTTNPIDDSTLLLYANYSFSSDHMVAANRKFTFRTDTQKSLYGQIKLSGTATVTTASWRGDFMPTSIQLENAYL